LKEMLEDGRFPYKNLNSEILGIPFPIHPFSVRKFEAGIIKQFPGNASTCLVFTMLGSIL